MATFADTLRSRLALRPASVRPSWALPQLRLTFGLLAALQALSCAALNREAAPGSEDGRGGDEDGRGSDDGDDGSLAAPPTRADGGAKQPTAREDAGPAPLPEPVDGESCVRGEYTAKARPLAMFILLDQSGSMQEDDDRWTPTSSALSAFVGLPGLTRTSVAMQYFPLGRSDAEKCEPESYAAPDVAMRELPANAEPVRASIDAHYFTKAECCDTVEHAGTPTRPAIEGAAAYMREWLAAHPEHVGVILLATDGEPSSVCEENKTAHVAKAIAAAAAAEPSVKTYVIGIGENDALDEMASAGDTGQGPLIVDGTGAMTEQQFLEAVSRIREAALPCDYALEAGADPSRVNLEWSTGATDANGLSNVRSAADCEKAGAKGWYYDDPSNPTRVNLCPATCSQLGRTDGATVRIIEGCETVVFI